MSELSPVSISISPNAPVTQHITQRAFNLSGTPLPEDMRSIVVEHFGIEGMKEEDLEVVYQYILSKSPTGEVDDIKLTIEALASRLAPNKEETFRKIRDLAINELSLQDPLGKVSIKRDIISKELPSLERQAEETGDWRFYLRASKEKERLGEISNPM